MRNYKCKIFHDEESTHYYSNKGEDADWHVITKSTIIVFYKDKIEVKY